MRKEEVMKLDKDKLEILMARKTWSYADLRKASGIGGSAICKMAKGKVSFTTKTAGKIANALGVDVTEIIQLLK